MEHIPIPKDCYFLHLNETEVLALLEFLLYTDEGLAEAVICGGVVEFTDGHSEAKGLARAETVVLEPDIQIRRSDCQILYDRLEQLVLPASISLLLLLLRAALFDYLL